jgi:hypothetical protein
VKLTISGASVATLDADVVLEGFTVSSRKVSSTLVRSTGTITGISKIASADGGQLSVTANNMKGDVGVTATRVNHTNITIAGLLDGGITASQSPGVSDSTFGLSLARVNGPVAVSLTRPTDATMAALDARKDMTVGVLGGGNSRVTISGSSVAGSLKINQTGGSSKVFVTDTVVGADLAQKATSLVSAIDLSGGSVAGTASFAGGNSAKGSLIVGIDDATIGNLTYVGGAGQNLLNIETDAAKAGKTLINGNLSARLGAGDDRVQFGDFDNGQPSAAEAVQFGKTSTVKLDGGPGADELLDFNSNTSLDSLTLVSIDRSTFPP